MAFLILALCIIAVGAILTLFFYQWLKIKRILENPDEVEIDYQIYIESDDESPVI